MKKLLLLALISITTYNLSAQIDTLYRETWDDPVDSVTNLLKGAATIPWNDTANLSISGNESYHGIVQPGNLGTVTEASFVTDSFSTIGYAFVFLDFYHICKINQVNQGLIRISTDGGNTWTQFQAPSTTPPSPGNVTYLSSSNWRSSSNFQEASYNVPNQGINTWFSGTDPAPQQNWWRQENFDISLLALGATGNGFADVRLEFAASYVLNPTQITNRPFGAGWWIDNLMITASTCELFPPRIRTNYNPVSTTCYVPAPTGGVTQLSTNSYLIGAQVTDSVPGNPNPLARSGIDSVTVFYRIRNAAGVGPWQLETLTSTNPATSEYEGTLNNILLDDTVEYYYRAWDLACPNTTRFPDSLANPQDPYRRFYIKGGLPFKCGTPFCGALPGTINSFPWEENFESADWQAGTGVGDAGSSHRGIFPNDQRGNKYWFVVPLPTATGYAWSVKSGGPTGTPFTGPNNDHSPTGSRYLYSEASQGNINNNSQLITPCIDLTNNTGCLNFEFYYHMFGEDMGNLRVDIDTGTNGAAWLVGAAVIRGEQQTAATDPWEKVVIPLDAYNGQYIRIRMLTVKRTTDVGSAARGDMAIDDLRIYEPVPVDAEVFKVLTPVKGFCTYGVESVDVAVRNNGCTPITSLALQYRLNSGGTPGAIQNATFPVNLNTGDSTIVTITPGVNLTPLNTYFVDVWANMALDTVPDNDTATSDTVVHRAAFTTFPLIMDFEGLPVNSNQTGNSVFRPKAGLDPNYQWRIGSRFTDTRNTGPRGGHPYGQGQYIYTEGTGSTGNVSTYLETERCLDFTGMNNPSLDMFVHLFGSNLAQISVQVTEPGVDPIGVWNTVPNSVSFGSQTREMDDYEFLRANLSAYSNKQVKVRIAVTRSGTGGNADAAIDKIVVYDRIANDGGIEKIDLPTFSLPANTPISSILPNGSLRPRVTMRSYGTNALSNEDIVLRVTPLTGANQGIPTLFTSSTSHSAAVNNNNTFFIQSLANFQIPQGACEVCAYTTTTGDSYAFNDTVCRIVTGQGSFNIDFSDNFDASDNEASGFFAWEAGGTSTPKNFLQWEFGEAPSSSRFSSFQANDNIWATNLSDGYFIDGVTEILRTPEFDNFDTVVAPTLRFFQNIEMGTGAAGGLDYALGGWQTLGEQFGTIAKDTVNLKNWYTNPDFGTVASPLLGGMPGFVNATPGNNRWVLSQYSMSELNFNPNAIQFRFRFISNLGANSGRNLDGWAIDDFEMYIPPQNSAAPTDFRLINPLQIPDNDQPIDIFITNTGAKLLDSCLVTVSILDVNTGNVTWQGPTQSVVLPRFFIRGSRTRISYNTPWPASTVTSGDHILCIITSRPNAKQDNVIPDDTLKQVISVLPEFFFNIAAGDTSYCNDFENPTSNNFPFIPLNTETFARGISSWELGTPNKLGGAASGSNAWVTRLTGNYDTLERSGLYSPVFQIDTGSAYEISFLHNFDTEPFHDGGNFEVSLDGGLNWSVIGFANQDNWYTEPFVTSLDIIKPGWSGISGGYDTAKYVVEFDTSALQAVFRFRFQSDYAVQRPGWAIDDFCLQTTTSRPQFVIGSEEHSPAPDTYIGELSPNPTADVTHLPIFVGQAQGASVAIYNVIGQKVYDNSYDLSGGTNTLVFETIGWKAGIYFVNINIAGQRLTRKLVVK
jgi:hypothetical protein